MHFKLPAYLLLAFAALQTSASPILAREAEPAPVPADYGNYGKYGDYGTYVCVSSSTTMFNVTDFNRRTRHQPAQLIHTGHMATTAPISGRQRQSQRLHQ